MTTPDDVIGTLGKHKDDYWGSVAVIEMCRLAAEYARENEGVSVACLAEALDLAFRNLSYFGHELFPMINDLRPRGNES